MHHLKWSYTDNNVEKYECLLETFKSIEEHSFRNNDSDCKKLIKLAGMLFLQRDNIYKYFTDIDTADKHINNYWLRRKRAMQVDVKNIWSIIVEHKECNSIFISELFKKHCE